MLRRSIVSRSLGNRHRRRRRTRDTHACFLLNFMQAENSLKARFRTYELRPGNTTQGLFTNANQFQIAACSFVGKLQYVDRHPVILYSHCRVCRVFLWLEISFRPYKPLKHMTLILRKILASRNLVRERRLSIIVGTGTTANLADMQRRQECKAG